MDIQKTRELLEAQGENLEEAIQTAKALQLLARHATGVLEKVKEGVSQAAENLKREA